jgi:hypothetical protein
MARCIRVSLAIVRLATGTFAFMRRHSVSRRFAFIATGVLFALPAGVALFPCAARAECSHLVTSKRDRWATLMPSLIRDALPEQASNGLGPFQSFSIPQAPRRCLGAWCAESPSAPAAPVGTVPARAELWAWLVTEPIAVVTSCSRLLLQASALRASHRSADILRPPRRTASA